MDNKERADRLEAMIDRMSETIDALRGLLIEGNDLLRGAYQITLRKGNETNWDAYTKSVADLLARQHYAIYKNSMPECSVCSGYGFVRDKWGRLGKECPNCKGSGIFYRISELENL